MPKTKVIFGNRRKCACCKRVRLFKFFTKTNLKSGYYSYCCDCANKKNRSSYLKHWKERVRANMAYRQTPKGKAVQKAASDKQLIVNAKKIYARQEVLKALRRGDLIKPKYCDLKDKTCRGKLEAHHPSYSKPLNVVWLCKKHHMDNHYHNKNVR